MLKSVKVTTPEEVYPKEYSNANEDYTVEYPKGWYPHEFEKGVIFTQNEFTDEASDTEGYALGGQFIITMENLADTEDVETYDDWLELYGIDEDSEFLKEKETVTVGDIEMIRAVMEAGGAEGDVLTYVYFYNAADIITLSHYPYDPETQDSKDFEEVVQSFKSPERQELPEESPEE
jgi:hypothetical protein